MQRRFALSAALALTVVVLFGLIAVGKSNGMFGDSPAGDEATAAAAPADDVAAALLYLAAISPKPAASPIVEYVYVDAPAEPPIIRYVTQAAAAPEVSPTGIQDGASAAPAASVAASEPSPVQDPIEASPVRDDDDVEHEDDVEHPDEDEHEEDDAHEEEDD